MASIKTSFIAACVALFLGIILGAIAFLFEVLESLTISEPAPEENFSPLLLLAVLILTPALLWYATFWNSFAERRNQRARRKAVSKFESIRTELERCFENLRILSEPIPTEKGHRIACVVAFDNMLTSGDYISIHKGDRLFNDQKSPSAFTLHRIFGAATQNQEKEETKEETWLFLADDNALAPASRIHIREVIIELTAAPAGLLRFNIITLTAIWNVFAFIKVPILTTIVTGACVFGLGFSRSLFDQQATASAWHKGSENIRGSVRLKPGILKCLVEGSETELLFLDPLDVKDSKSFIQRCVAQLLLLSPSGGKISFKTTYDAETADI